MHQIKIFKGLESDIGGLEAEVNTWLAGKPDAKIVQIFGNIAPQSAPADEKSPGLPTGAFLPSDLLVIVHYTQAG